MYPSLTPPYFTHIDFWQLRNNDANSATCWTTEALWFDSRKGQGTF